MPRLLDRVSINRESSQAFTLWGHQLGSVLGLDLVLSHVPDRPETQPLVLLERRMFGLATATPTALLRFAAADGARLAHHRPGDLIGILPPGETSARFYSLASHRKDGQVEICARLLDGGVCSTLLHAMPVGNQVHAFIRTNPDFHAPKRPLILVGAGTGIAPLAGMIRANTSRRAIRLYWGGRDPASDHLYGSEIPLWIADGRLGHFAPAFSRSEGRYVQDRLREDAVALADFVRRGATIMVCGGAGMAAAVRATVDELLAASDLDVHSLKAQRRYLEDIY